MTILDLFDAACADDARAPGLNGVSYAGLATGVLRVCAGLHDRGVSPGDRVAIYCENRLAFVYAYLALLRLGAIAVPANVLYRRADLSHVLEDAGVRLAVASEETAPHLRALSHPPGMVDASDIERWAADETVDGVTPAQHPADDDPALLVYTSGTTGRSKGAILTHANLATIAAQLVTAWRWTARDTLAMALPLFHVHGLCAGLNGTLAAGGHLVLHKRFDAATILEALRRPDVTMFFGVPTMYVRLLEALGDGQPPRLRLCVSGSAALAPDVHERFEQLFGMTILERYGATEFGFALGNRYGGPRVPGSVGVPFPGVRVRIAQPGSSDALPAGEIGELLVSGPNVTPGYWRNPEATAAAFVIDAEGARWYRTGDLSIFDRQNEVYRIVGRLKELIISGGFNVYPLEVECEIDRFPCVRASAVVGMPDPARGEIPVAFIEASDGFDADALLNSLREQLASFKVPKRVTVIDSLPRNALGKVEKHKLLRDATVAAK
ncbi:MAG: class I adenylate-forming enzyme family protein [Candidatus Velthaea sp.]